MKRTCQFERSLAQALRWGREGAPLQHSHGLVTGCLSGCRGVEARGVGHPLHITWRRRGHSSFKPPDQGGQRQTDGRNRSQRGESRLRSTKTTTTATTTTTTTPIPQVKEKEAKSLMGKAPKKRTAGGGKLKVDVPDPVRPIDDKVAMNCPRCNHPTMMPLMDPAEVESQNRARAEAFQVYHASACQIPPRHPFPHAFPQPPTSNPPSIGTVRCPRQEAEAQ